MKEKKLKGYVLRHHTYLGTNKVVTLFTETGGKEVVVVRGVRKVGSSHVGALEILNEVNLLVSKERGGGLYVVKESAHETIAYNLREDYESISKLYYIAEYINSFVQESSLEEGRLYNLLKETLKQANSNPNKFYILMRAFELKGLVIFGFVGALKHCSGCGMVLKGGGKSYYAQINKLSKVMVSSNAGWIFCNECSVSSYDKVLMVKTYKTLLDFRYIEDYKELLKIELDKKTKEELDISFEKLIESVIGRRFSSMKVYKEGDILS